MNVDMHTIFTTRLGWELSEASKLCKTWYKSSEEEKEYEGIQKNWA